MNCHDLDVPSKWPKNNSDEKTEHSYSMASGVKVTGIASVMSASVLLMRQPSTGIH